MVADGRVLTIYTASFLTNLILAIVAPFYPIEAERMGIPVWQTGVIFCAMPLSTFVFSPFIGSYLSRIGRRRAFTLGHIFEVLMM